MKWTPITLACAVLLSSACQQSQTDLTTDPIRFVDRFPQATVAGTPATDSGYPPTEWTFDDGADGFTAGMGIEGLTAEAGRLSGKTTDPLSGISVPVSLAVPEDEELHVIEVVARVSSGASLTVRLAQGEQLILPQVLNSPFGSMQTPLQAGDESHTYSIRPSQTVSAANIQHLVITPSDTAGAEFEIDSVRLVFRGEHLASIPAGPGWYGLGEIYREAIASRAAETIRLTETLPANPRFEAQVGLVSGGAAKFTFTAESAQGTSLSTTAEVPEKGSWQPITLELGELAGEEVTLSLALESEDKISVGFWGAPTVRSALPEVVAESATRPQGVILVIADTLRSDHLGLYGYERNTAPHLERLANEGVSFSDTISQATWTKVSVPAIQTSLFPSTHTVANIPDRLPASATTIAEIYRDAGYATLALTSIPFVGRMTNLHQGYEEFHEAGSVGDEGAVSSGMTGKTSEQYVDRLVPWLEAHRDLPFFVLLHVSDPHSPYRPPSAFETSFAEEGAMDRLDEMTELVRPEIEHPIMRSFGMPERKDLVAAGVDPEEFVRIEHDGYDGSILAMDSALERLSEALERLDLRDRVLVGLTSDHGTEFLDHDNHFHGHTAYGELNRVPLFFWGPSFVPQGVRVDRTVQTIDVMPTLLEISGLELPEAAQGQSLRPFFDDPSHAWDRPAITELPLNLRGRSMTSLIHENWKLIQLGGEDSSEFELYDHRQDPLNQVDVASDHPEVVDQLASRLNDWRGVAIAARLDDEEATATMDSDELERLRALGYVE